MTEAYWLLMVWGWHPGQAMLLRQADCTSRVYQMGHADWQDKISDRLPHLQIPAEKEAQGCLSEKYSYAFALRP